MRFQRSLLQILLGGTIGLCLTFILHACQPARTPQAPASPPPTATTPSPEPAAAATLSPEVAALVASAAPNGLYDPPRGEVRLVVISDLNSAYGSTDYDPEVDKGIALAPFWKPDLVVCGGDMVAGQNPSLTVDRLKAMWQAFDDHVAAPLRKAKIPFGFTIGNHDASSALGVTGQFLFQRERNIAAEYWKAPTHNPGVQFVDRYEFPFFYTFEHKDVFFLAWDGSSSQIPKEKLAWVEKALASPKAQAAKMRVLLSHLPLYGVAIGRDEAGEVMSNADQIRAMLEKYKVHTYISGHHHAYYPAHKGKLQLLHAGILGSGPRQLLDSGIRPRKSLTVVDIKFDSPDLTTYTTYDMQSMQLIKNEELPRFITGHNGMVLRRDVENLSAAERSQCESRLNATLCTA
jgi:hypothetical protein